MRKKMIIASVFLAFLMAGCGLLTSVEKDPEGGIQMVAASPEAKDKLETIKDGVDSLSDLIYIVGAMAGIPALAIAGSAGKKGLSMISIKKPDASKKA